jgi:hypothetical protein
MDILNSFVFFTSASEETPTANSARALGINAAAMQRLMRREGEERQQTTASLQP